jgi:hypothetical protein
MTCAVKWIDCTKGTEYERRIDDAKDSSKEMLHSIYEADLTKMKKLIKNYNYQDMYFEHPVLWEAIEQCGCDFKATQNPVHKRQNEQIKWFLTREKFLPILHNAKWTDKYGNTAYERLAGHILTMRDKDLVQWIQNSDFGLGKEYNKYLTPDNITVEKSSVYNSPSGRYSLSDKFPKASHIDLDGDCDHEKNENCEESVVV